MDRMILLFIGSFFALAVMAQSVFFGSPKPPTAAGTTASPVILSPTEFNNQVSDISNKNEAEFKQRLNQKISQVPPPTVPTVTPPPESKETPPPPSNTEETTAPPAATPETSAPPPAIPPPPAASKAPPESYSTTPPSSTGGKSDTYTGFGSSPSGSTAAPPKNQGSSGGWNIKY